MDRVLWWANALMALIDVVCFVLWKEPRWLGLLLVNGGLAFIWREDA